MLEELRGMVLFTPRATLLLIQGFSFFLHREWFSVLARQMFNPGYALFQPQAADSLTYQPNKVRPFVPPSKQEFAESY